MKIYLKVFGPLKNYFKSDKIEFEIQLKDINLTDLFNEIDNRFKERIPERYWDHKEKKFKNNVMLMTKNKAIQNLNIPLKNEQTIIAITITTGG